MGLHFRPVISFFFIICLIDNEVKQKLNSKRNTQKKCIFNCRIKTRPYLLRTSSSVIDSNDACPTQTSLELWYSAPALTQ